MLTDNASNSSRALVYKHQLQITEEARHRITKVTNFRAIAWVKRLVPCWDRMVALLLGVIDLLNVILD